MRKTLIALMATAITSLPSHSEVHGIPQLNDYQTHCVLQQFLQKEEYNVTQGTNQIEWIKQIPIEVAARIIPAFETLIPFGQYKDDKGVSYSFFKYNGPDPEMDEVTIINNGNKHIEMIIKRGRVTYYPSGDDPKMKKGMVVPGDIQFFLKKSPSNAHAQGEEKEKEYQVRLGRFGLYELERAVLFCSDLLRYTPGPNYTSGK